MIALQATFTLAGFSALDPNQLRRESERAGLSSDWWSSKANSYRLPRGREPGRGYILLLHRDFKTLSQDVGTHVVSVRCGDTTINLTGNCIVKSTAILGCQVLTDETALLVEVADARVLGNLTAINKEYNLPSPEGTNYDVSLNGGSLWTWNGMIQSIWSFLPASAFGVAPTVPPGFPTNEPEGFQFIGIPAWEALNSVLDHIDYTVILTRAGTFQFVRLDTADASVSTLAASTSSLLDPGHITSSDICSFPEKVRVYFPSNQGEYQNSTDEQDATAADYRRTHSAYFVDTTTLSVLGSDVATIAGTVEPVWGSRLAIFDDTGLVLTNTVSIAADALDLATTHLKRRLNSELPVDEVYSGLIGVNPGSTLSGVAWFDLGEGIKTHVVRHPREMNPDGSPLVRAGLVGSLTSIARESTAPPDITRTQLPYPRRLEGVLRADLSVDGAGVLCRINKGIGSPPVWTADGTKDVTIFSRTRGELTDHRVTATFNEQIHKWLIDGDGHIRFGEVVTDPIPAIAGSSPGTGAVDLKKFTNGSIAATAEDEVTVYNFSANAVPVGTIVLLAKHTLDGRYIVADVLWSSGDSPDYDWTVGADLGADRSILNGETVDFLGTGGLTTTVADLGGGLKSVTYVGSDVANVKYARCILAWEKPGTPNCNHVSCRGVTACDGSTGYDAEQTPFDVILLDGPGDPNLEGNGNESTSDHIAYIEHENGDKVCVSDYLDDKIGTMKMWLGTVGSIPQGWARMDASANSTGSAIDMATAGKYLRGKSGTTAAAPGDTSGVTSHNHSHAEAITGAQSVTIDTTVATMQTTAIVIANKTGLSTDKATSGVTIVDHPFHNHNARTSQAVGGTGAYAWQTGGAPPSNRSGREVNDSDGSHTTLAHPVVEPDSGNGHLHTVPDHNHTNTAHGHTMNAHTHTNTAHLHTVPDNVAVSTNDHLPPTQSMHMIERMDNSL